MQHGDSSSQDVKRVPSKQRERTTTKLKHSEEEIALSRYDIVLAFVAIYQRSSLSHIVDMLYSSN